MGNNCPAGQSMQYDPNASQPFSGTGSGGTTGSGANTCQPNPTNMVSAAQHTGQATGNIFDTSANRMGDLSPPHD